MHGRLNVHVMFEHLRTLLRISTFLAEYACDMHCEIWKYAKSCKSAHTGELLIHRLHCLLLCNTLYSREPQHLNGSQLLRSKDSK